MKELTPQELQLKLKAGEPLRLVDVREEDEWNFCRLPGAEWIPLTRFAKEAPERLRAEETVVLYCHHGMRSRHAGQFLEQLGYREVINLTGGVDAWSREVDASVPRY